MGSSPLEVKQMFQALAHHGREVDVLGTTVSCPQSASLKEHVFEMEEDDTRGMGVWSWQQDQLINYMEAITTLEDEIGGEGSLKFDCRAFVLFHKLQGHSCTTLGDMPDDLKSLPWVQSFMDDRVQEFIEPAWSKRREELESIGMCESATKSALDAELAHWAKTAWNGGTLKTAQHSCSIQGFNNNCDLLFSSTTL